MQQNLSAPGKVSDWLLRCASVLQQCGFQNISTDFETNQIYAEGGGQNLIIKLSEENGRTQFNFNGEEQAIRGFIRGVDAANRGEPVQKIYTVDEADNLFTEEAPSEEDDYTVEEQPKKKKKKKRHRALIILLIIAAAAAAFWYFLIYQGPTRTVDVSLRAAKHADSSTIENYISSQSSSGTSFISSFIENETITDKFLDFDYTIDSQTVSDSTAQVQVTFTTYDFASIASETFTAENVTAGLENSQSLTSVQNSLINTFAEKCGTLTDSDKTKTATTTFSLKRAGILWTYDSITSDNIDAVTGGLYSWFTANYSSVFSTNSSSFSSYY